MKVVSLLSGGADSSTLLYFLATDPQISEIAPLAIDYNQRHKKELEAAKQIVKSLQDEIERLRKEAKTNFEQKIKNVKDIRQRAMMQNDFDRQMKTIKTVRDLKIVKFPIGEFGGSPLVDKNIDVPKQEEKKQAITVVPFRNTFLVTIAASYAKSIGFDTVATAPTYEDLAQYPDCRPIYFSKLTETLRLADTLHNLKILTPFIEAPKNEIYKVGLGLGVPYDKTWTCYKGEEKACGECDACKERIEGFARIGQKDPMSYAIDIDWDELFKKYEEEPK